MTVIVFDVGTTGTRKDHHQIIEQDFEDANPNSFFFMVGDVAPFKLVDWSQYGNDVMGARSIALSDIVNALD